MKCLFPSVECEYRNTGGCSRGDCVFSPQGIVKNIPSLAECQVHVQRQIWGSKMPADSILIVKCLYDFITKGE